MRIRVQIINESTAFSDRLGLGITAALQHQVDHDFRPTWGIAAQLEYVAQHRPDGAPGPDPDAWWLVILDDADQANALGYHDLTPRSLHPVGKAFAHTTAEAGAEISVTLSHELLEMLGDPYINTTALDPRSGRLYALENCDAVEADELGYDIAGVRVSDFVLPPYFDPMHQGKGQPLSFRGNVHEPFQLAAGGYLSYVDLSDLGGGWQQVTDALAEGVSEEAHGIRDAGFPDGSRRDRRRKLWDGHGRNRGLSVSSEALCA